MSRLIGSILLFVGVLGLLYINGYFSGVTQSVVYYAMGYPKSKLTAEEKISPMLKDVLKKVSPDKEVPVVVVLTGATGGLAIAQQEKVLPMLTMVGFKPTLSIVNVDNAISGRIVAKRVYDLAFNPYVEKVLYDGVVAKLFGDPNGSLDYGDLIWNLKMIHVDKAWDMGYDGRGVVVIVIDSGIKDDHPLLIRNGKSLVLEDVYIASSKDYTAIHGTHVAGIIAAQGIKTENGYFRGVAYGIDGFIDIIAFNERGEATLSDVLKALDVAYNKAVELKKPCVCTNSWGSYPINSDEINEIRKAAMKLTRVMPVVFAAGNFGPDRNSIAAPGDADDLNGEVITVGAVNMDGSIAEYSSRGPDRYGFDHNEPDVVAPGTMILSTIPSGMDKMSGTSMATPHVTGVIALMLSKNPYLTNGDCLDILTKSAKDLGSSGFDYDYGYGLVQADKAVELVEKPSYVVDRMAVMNCLFVCSIVLGILMLVKPEEVLSVLAGRDEKVKRYLVLGVVAVILVILLAYGLSLYLPTTPIIPPPSGDHPIATYRTEVKLTEPFWAAKPHIEYMKTERISSPVVPSSTMESPKLEWFPWVGKVELVITYPSGETVTKSYTVKVEWGSSTTVQFIWYTKQIGKHTLVVNLYDGNGVLIDTETETVVRET